MVPDDDLTLHLFQLHVSNGPLHPPGRPLRLAIPNDWGHERPPQTVPDSQKDGNNGTSEGANGLSEDSMSQITQILSSHLEFAMDLWVG